MMNSPKRYTITAALPYANGPIHLGHVAGAHLPADIYARYLRQNGATVLFVSGSDEHGVPITIRAKEEKRSPKVVVDTYHVRNKKALEDFNISYDIFDRTSSPIHHETASDFFKQLHGQNQLTEESTEQYYDQTYDQFLPDRYLMGQCPYCSYTKAYGDQCESCGSTLNITQLIEPISCLSHTTPIRKLTHHWFLPLNQYESWLKQWLLKEKKPIRSNVYGQCKSWLEQGLQPRAITRDLSWGVDVPLEHAKGKVLYVWFDAPIGYISATKTWAQNQQMNWECFWKDPSTRLVHFLGKDNIVFHAIIFPTMLKAHGSFILPEQIVGNEFLNLEGHKFSTSRNYAIWLEDYLSDFPGQQDTMRYMLCAIAPEAKDSNFTWKDFQSKNNNELVANLGNLVHRTLKMVHVHFDGIVPPCEKLDDAAKALLSELETAFLRVGEAIEQFRFKEALQRCMHYSSLGNKYMTEQQPWAIVKQDRAAAGTVLYVTLQLLGLLARLLHPFLPTTSQKIARMLNLPHLVWKGPVMHFISTGTKIADSEVLFLKIENATIQAQLDKLNELKVDA